MKYQCNNDGCCNHAEYELWLDTYEYWYICEKHAVEEGWSYFNLHFIGHEMSVIEEYAARRA